MEAFIFQQEDMFENLSRAYTNYKKTPKDRISQSYIEARLEHLETLIVNMSQIHCKIVGGTKREEKTELSYFKDNFYFKIEDTYLNYKIKLKEDLREYASITSEQPAKQTTSMTSCEVKLPQIQLPTFSGGYEEWQTFYDMFASLIHNNANLSSVQKLHYLKSSLSGEPENLLKNLSTTEMNYNAAWGQLIRRYNNKKHNSNEIMKRLFSQKIITCESASSIKQLLDTTSACLKSLNNLGIATSDWDVMVNHLIVSKLDTESRKLWESQINQAESDDLPTWEQLTRFMEMRFRTLEALEGNNNPKSITSSNMKQGPKQKSFHSTINNEKKITSTCVMCNEQHLLYQCKHFGKQSPEERAEFIQSKRLCFNCFAPTHSVNSCRQPTSCRRCGRRHHTLLHIEKSPNRESGSTGSPSNEQNLSPPKDPLLSIEPPEKVVAHFATRNNESKVLLATAVVKIKSASGYSQTIRALIDQGSEASFLSEVTAQSLGLKQIPVNGLVTGVGDSQARAKNKVSFILESVHKPFSVPVNAFVLSTLTSFLPSSKTSISNWHDIANLPLADPNFGSPGRVDLILGAEVYSEIILAGLMRHPSEHGPVAQNTLLGWILSGGVQGESSLSNERVISFHLQVKEDQPLKQFCEIERQPDSIEKKLPKEIRCEENNEIITRESESESESPYPEGFDERSNQIPLRRFQLREMLFKAPLLHEKYKSVMEIYIKENYTRAITNLDVMLPTCFSMRSLRKTEKVKFPESFEVLYREESLNYIKEKFKEREKSFVLKTQEKIKRVCWNENTDNFESIILKLPKNTESITKRTVLSDIARLYYDPLEWLAPVIITAKKYMQKLWNSGLSWDEHLTPELFEEWIEFRNDLANVHDVVIPRWLETRDSDDHVFADASKTVYMKTVNQIGNVSIHLVTAKTKVSPIEKEISIQRLELYCVVILATKLIYEVSQIMQIPEVKLYIWSDSTIVLAWLREEPCRWVTFVSNRVSEILTMLDRDQWGHLDTYQNPADCASRGMPISELMKHNLWWHGPEWLHQNNEYMGLQDLQDISTTEEEIPIRKLTAIVQLEKSFVWNRFSILRKAFRVVSYCRKVLKLKLPIEERLKFPRSVKTKEINEVLNICVKKTQELYFKEEVKQLKSQESITKKSQLHTLGSALDENGTLRVGERIHQARVQFDNRHPVILPCESHLTKFIMSDTHIKTLHGGTQMILNFDQRVTQYNTSEDSTLKLEEPTTVLTEKEACLNSLTNGTNDPLPLTLGHFLVGEPLIVIPDQDYEKVQMSGLQRWKLVQRMVNDFWKKRSDEYLVTLNQRYKWTNNRSEPKIDDIVIVKDHNLPSAKWLLGRIVEKHTGKHDVTRVVSIKTKKLTL